LQDVRVEADLLAVLRDQLAVGEEEPRGSLPWVEAGMGAGGLQGRCPAAAAIVSIKARSIAASFVNRRAEVIDECGAPRRECASSP
jgi:hypothetical protein